MGFFDKLRGSSNTDLSPRAAMLLACISMIAADGSIDDDEISIVYRIDGEGETAAFDKAIRAWKTVSSPTECIALVVPHLDEQQQRFTLANLVDIAMADGVLAGREKALLERYLQAFDLEASFVEAVADVISVKNDRSPFKY